MAINVNKVKEAAWLFQIFNDYYIVPALIDRAPLEFAEVRYLNPFFVNLSTTVVRRNDDGGFRTPIVEWNAYPSQYYTLMLIDADSPSTEEPLKQQYVHWLVVNIPRNSVPSGEVLFEYLPAFMQPGSGIHRCFILIYHQQFGRINSSGAPQTRRYSPRMGFLTRNFAEFYNLGHPIAGIIFFIPHPPFIPRPSGPAVQPTTTN